MPVLGKNSKKYLWLSESDYEPTASGDNIFLSCLGHAGADLDLKY